MKERSLRLVWKRASASTTSATLSIGLFPSSRARCSRQRRSIIVMSRFFTSKSCLLGVVVVHTWHAHVGELRDRPHACPVVAGGDERLDRPGQHGADRQGSGV